MGERAKRCRVSVSAVSQHLRLLLQADLVEVQRVGRERWYRLNPGPLERVADAITALNGDYRLDGRTAVKIAIAPNGSVP